MVKRKIVKIDEEKCNGCGQCIPACPEGAIQIIDGKARLVSDLFCDGLGACLGDCPLGAITIEEREAEPYSERKVMERISQQGENVVLAHLKHLKEHGEKGYLAEAITYLKERGIKDPLEKVAAEQTKEPHSCPGAKMMDFRNKKSGLQQWPIQSELVPPNAPYFNETDLLIVADCVPFAYPNFHQDFLKNKSLVIGCPKLDDLESYKQKITEILRLNEIKNVKVIHMEVPCCFALEQIVKEAVESSGKEITITKDIISINGEKIT